MSESRYILDQPARNVVLRTISDVAQHRRWGLWAVHVRSNHVHTVVSASAKPEKIMIDFKAYASRRLKEQLHEPADRHKRWTQHGGTLYLWTKAEVLAKIEYTINGQGGPMAVYNGREQFEEYLRLREQRRFN